MVDHVGYSSWDQSWLLLSYASHTGSILGHLLFFVK